MLIGIDATVLSYNKEGIGNYVLQLLKQLGQTRKKMDEFDIVLFVHPDFTGQVEYETIMIKKRTGILSSLRTAREITSKANENEVDLILSTHTHLLSIFHKRCAWIIHDISPIIHPEYFFESKFSIKRSIFNLMFKVGIKKTHQILTISEFSKSEIIDFYGVKKEKVISIGASWGEWVNSVSGVNREINSKLLAQNNLVAEEFFITLGTLSPRKNIETILHAYVKYSKSLAPGETPQKLVIVGKNGWLFEPILDLFEKQKNEFPELNLSENVIFTGFAENDLANALIENCSAFISASHYEGFGMPPLEALILGRKIILSDIPVYKEIYGGIAQFFPVKDSSKLASIMTKISEIDTDPANVSALKSKYSWEQVATNFLNAIQRNG